MKNNIIKLIEHFENATMDLDALDNYFKSTRDIINKKHATIGKKYELSLKIAKILDSIYNLSEEERMAKIEEIRDKEIIEGIKLSEIMDIVLVNNNSLITYVLKDGYKNNKYSPSYARKEICIISNQVDIFVRAILTNLIIVFEKYFSTQYTILVENEPQKYFGGKTINVSQIFEKGIDTIIADELKSEVESNMFDSLKALDKVNDKSGINIDRYISIRKEFEEIYYRRNLFVHNDGIVNEMYLSKVDNRYTKDLKIGQTLICDDFYLENAICVAKKIISTLHFEMLKFFKAEADAYDKLSEFAFSALNDEDYLLAEHIYDILRRQKLFDYNNKIVFEIDYIIALKQQGKDTSELTDNMDVSIAIDKYKIAKECLINNHKNVYDILSRSYPDSFNAIMIRDWPLFKEFRETEYYTTFVNEHKSDFDVLLFEENA